MALLCGALRCGVVARPAPLPLVAARRLSSVVDSSALVLDVTAPAAAASPRDCAEQMTRALSERDASNALHAWELFRAGNKAVPPTPPMLSLLVEAHTSRGDYANALRALQRESSDFNLPIPRWTMNSLLRSAVVDFHGVGSRGKGGRQTLADYGVPRSFVSDHLLMTADLLENNVAAAAERLRRLRTAGRRIPQAMINTFFMTCSEAERASAWASLEQLSLLPDDGLLWRMWKWTATHDAPYSNRLLTLLLAKNSLPPADMYMAPRFVDRLFQEASQDGRVEQAELLWRLMRRRSAAPGATPLAAAQHDSYLYMQLRAGAQAEAFRALSDYPSATLSDHMKRFWIRNHLHTPVALDDALGLLHEQHRAGVVAVPELAVELLLRGCAQQADLDRAYDIFSALDDFAVVPTVSSINALLLVCSNVGKAASALRLFAVARKLEIEPTPETVTLVIHACLNGRDIDGAFSVLRELVVARGVLFERDVLDRVLRRCIVMRRTELRDEVLQIAAQAGLYDADDFGSVLAEAEALVAKRAESLRESARRD